MHAITRLEYQRSNDGRPSLSDCVEADFRQWMGTPLSSMETRALRPLSGARLCECSPARIKPYGQLKLPILLLPGPAQASEFQCSKVCLKPSERAFGSVLRLGSNTEAAALRGGPSLSRLSDTITGA